MIAIKNVHVIDGTGVPPIDDCTIIYENGKFVSVGAGISIPEQATCIDGHGGTIIPGLIDAHTHLAGSSGLYHPAMSNRTQSYNYTEFREGCLRWGVVAARTCGQFTEQTLAFRDEVNSGVIERSPRVMVSGPMFQAPHGHPCYTVFLSNPDVAQNACVMVDDNTDIDRIMAHFAHMKVDFTKVFYAHLNKMDYPNTVPRITKEQLKRIIESSHAHKLKVAVHVDNPDEMWDVVECGADCVEHILGAGESKTKLSQELIAMVKESGVVVDPTMISIKRFDPLSSAKSVWNELKIAVKQLYDAGVPLVVGCDSGIPFVPFGECVHDEMACLVEAGIPPLEVLTMATSKNAALLGMDGEIGTIETGKDADFVLLNHDPLEDISYTRDIRLVVTRGKIVTDMS